MRRIYIFVTRSSHGPSCHNRIILSFFKLKLNRSSLTKIPKINSFPIFEGMSSPLRDPRINFHVSQNLYIRSFKRAARVEEEKKEKKRRKGNRVEWSRSEKCRSAGARRISLARRLLKNSDNTSSCVGLHLNVCIHTLWCIALTRGVVKIIQTDPDFFFSFFQVWDTF